MDGATSTISYLELVGVGTSDANKPTYRQLLDEGLSQTAIETLMLSRDAITIMPSHEVADWLRLSVANHPLDVTDVYPDGPPCRCDTWGLQACLAHRDYDPDDAQLRGIVWAAGSRGL